MSNQEGITDKLAEWRAKFKKAIAERWRTYRESKAVVCKACGGWGEIGHGPENRWCSSCGDGIVRGDSWGLMLDNFVESVLYRVGIEADEVW